MTKLTLLLALALPLAAAGCKKKGGADCDKAINHSMDLAKADMQKMGNDDKAMSKMKDIGLSHCKDDKWSPDAVQCMIDAKTEADAQACYGKLTQDQQDKMNKAAMEAMQPPAPAGGSAAPAGSDMAGSAGSAAAETTPTPATGSGTTTGSGAVTGSGAAAGSAASPTAK